MRQTKMCQIPFDQVMKTDTLKIINGIHSKNAAKYMWLHNLWPNKVSITETGA